MALIRSLLAAFAALLLFQGCTGYRIGPTKPVELSQIDSIAVPIFKNDTLEPRCSSIVTHNVIEEIQTDGTYRVTSLSSADAVLRATITRLDRRQLRAARFNALRSREMAIHMHVDYTLEETGTGAILSTGSINGRTNVFLDPNLQLSERQALDDASQELARNLVSRIAEGW